MMDVTLSNVWLLKVDLNKNPNVYPFILKGLFDITNFLIKCFAVD